MSLKALREKKAALVASMRGRLSAAETEGRELTAEEIAAHDKDVSDVNALTAQIDRLAGMETLEAGLEAALPAAAARGIPRTPGGAVAKKEFESFGEFIHAARFRPNDQRLAWVDGVGASLQAEQRMDDGASGGFALPVQFRNEILSVDPFEQIIRTLANVIPAGDPPDSEVKMPALDQGAGQNIYGGVQMQWTGEGGTKPPTGVNLKEITLRPQELSGTITITDKLLRNWQASGPFLQKQFRMALMGFSEQAFFQGNGVNKPLGVYNAGCTIAVARNTASTVRYVDLVAMLGLLLPGPGAGWVMTQYASAQLRLMTDPQGHYIWIDNARDGGLPSLLGLPVRISDRVPVYGTAGDILLANFSNYLIKDGSGPFVAASEHVLFTQNKTVMKAFMNVDGQPWLNAPIKRENGELQSPFIKLV